jgi:hypothetical protein
MNTNKHIPASIPIAPRMHRAKGPRRKSVMRTQSNRRAILLATAFASVCIFAVVVLAHPTEPRPQAALPARLLAGELPETLAELNAWYVEPAAGANAADYYSKGLDALKLTGGDLAAVPFFGQGKMPALGAPIDASMKTALGKLVTANREPLLWLAEGAKYRQCRYPLDLTQGLDLIYRPFSNLEKGSLVLGLAALFHAESKHGGQAANDVMVELCLADSLGDTPSTLAQLLRGRIISYSVTALQQTLNRTPLPPAGATELMKVLQRMEKREADGEIFNRTMAGERAMGFAALAHPQQLGRALAAPDLKMPAERRRQINDRIRSGVSLTAERTFFDGAFHQLAAARQVSFPERLKADVLGHQLVEQAHAKGLFALDLVLPSMSRRTGLEAKCLTNLRLAITAVAIEQFRAAHKNQYPLKLSELVPYYVDAVPSDPFDAQSLKYQKIGAGYALSSVGAEGSLSFTVVHAPAP